MHRLLPITLLLALTGAPDSQPGPDPPRATIRGMTVSCPTWGPIWGSPAMAEALDELREIGVEWVAIHPYARIRADGSVRHQDPASLDFLPRAVALVKARDMRLFWKPHLAYWGSFSWRGAIRFDDPEAWQRFYRDYEAFIVAQARFAEAQGVGLLALGVELDATLEDEAAWRRIVAAVRAVYSGQLTYAANWDKVGTVPFWDALDFIGVQAYYPVAEHPDPSATEVADSWQRHLLQLQDLSRRYGGRPILITELGYSRSRSAAQTPWVTGMDDDSAVLRLRARLMDTALTELQADPGIAGIFWWKWMPGVARGHDADFSMKDPEALDLLRRHWARPGPTHLTRQPAPTAANAGTADTWTSSGPRGPVKGAQ